MGIVLLAQEVVAQRCNMGECLEHHIAIVVVLDVVQTNGSRMIQRTIDGTRRFRRRAVQVTNRVSGERWVQQVFDVVQRGI